MISISSVILEKKYPVKITARHHSITADEVIEVGGGDSGFRSEELLLASLAACTCITLRMYAERKNWDVGEINVQLSLETKTENGMSHSHIHREISYTKELDKEQRHRLFQIADKCPVHKILTGEIQIETT
jgi:putative redox protein